MRIVSFNVNGIRSMAGKLKNGEKKGHPQNNVIQSLIEEEKPDILCLQEIKTQSEADMRFITQYSEIYTNFSTIKKGYSGVALLTNMKAEWVEYGFDRYDEEFIGEYLKYDWIDEGRIIIAKFEKCIVVTVYVPNSQAKLARLDERIAWEQVLRMFLMELQREFEIPIILCGDLNCAFQDIDIHNPKTNAKSAGFSKEERDEFCLILDAGFTDSFRYLHPNLVKYSYWSNFHNAREKNMGWRIDYLLVSSSFRNLIQSADILEMYMGSDHAPVCMDIEI
jgi:exodeoxyribonuclease-3